PIFFHRPTFDAWPARLQTEMRAAVAAAVAFQRDLARIEDEEARAAIAAQGCEIAVLSPDELAAFAAAVAPSYAEARGVYPVAMLGLLPGGLRRPAGISS